MDNNREMNAILDEISELKRRIVLLEMLVSKMVTDKQPSKTSRFSVRELDDK